MPLANFKIHFVVRRRNFQRARAKFLIDGGIRDDQKNPYTQADFRFTTKGNVLYAFCMAKPMTDLRIVSLAKNSKYADKRIAAVSILGCKDKLKWKQTAEGLVITKPSQLADSHAVAVKVEFKK